MAAPRARWATPRSLTFERVLFESNGGGGVYNRQNLKLDPALFRPPPQDICAPDVTGVLSKSLEHRNTLHFNPLHHPRVGGGDGSVTTYNRDRRGFIDDSVATIERKVMSLSLSPDQTEVLAVVLAHFP